MSEFKKPVPESRTIVDGIWSDLLDDWSDTFASSESGTVQKVNVDNMAGLIAALVKLAITQDSQNDEIINQLKLLNVRFEEMAGTKINLNDIEA